MADTTQENVLSGPGAGMEDEQDAKESPQWESVDSSRFTAMKYDPEELTLSVRWKDGSVGRYLNVPEETYEKLRTSDSLGKHLSQHIIPHFQYVRGDASSS